MNRYLLFILSLLASAALSLAASDCLCGNTICACDHNHQVFTDGPIGVMGDHAHHAGSWMFSYRHMYMSMKDNYDGNDNVSDAAVNAAFMVVPEDMDMEMHMLGAMTAVNDNLTLMLMVPWIRKHMNLHSRMPMPGGTDFDTESEGFGDLRLTAITPVWQRGRTHLIASLGLSMPTGSIDEKDGTPMDPSANRNLPYPMQLGSGTWDLIPGITLTGHTDRLDWGAQVLGTVHLGENSNDYTLGDKIDASLWLATPITDRVRGSVRLSAHHNEDVDGADPNIMRSMMMMGMQVNTVPTAQPNLRGGSRLVAHLGLDWKLPENWIIPGTDKRLAVELGTPIWRDLDAHQLGIDWMTTVGLQFAW